MEYDDLLKRAWATGRYDVGNGGLSVEVAPPAAARRQIQAEMESIVEREAAEALPCLTAHQEGVMKLAPFVKFREEKFGAVLFETRAEKVYTLNPTAAAVVREVLAGATRADLGQRLKARFEDASGRLEAEAAGVLEDLKAKGLIAE